MKIITVDLPKSIINKNKNSRINQNLSTVVQQQPKELEKIQSIPELLQMSQPVELIQRSLPMSQPLHNIQPPFILTHPVQPRIQPLMISSNETDYDADELIIVQFLESSPLVVCCKLLSKLINDYALFFKALI